MLQNRFPTSIAARRIRKLKPQDSNPTSRHPGDLTSQRSIVLGLRGKGLVAGETQEWLCEELLLASPVSDRAMPAGSKADPIVTVIVPLG